jgi:hypothetical protein
MLIGAPSSMKCIISTSYQTDLTTFLTSSQLFDNHINKDLCNTKALPNYLQIQFSTLSSTSFHVMVCSSPKMTQFLDAVVLLLKLLPTQCCPTLILLYFQLQAHCSNTTYITNAFHLYILSILYDCTYYLNTGFFYKPLCRRCFVILLHHFCIFTLKSTKVFNV